MSGEELREAMRRFPAPVAVVTTVLEGERFGLTVGSLVSLSLNPPLVGISIGRDSSSHEPIRRAGGWAVSLLAGSQADVAQHFARSGIPPVALWVGVDVRDGRRGPRALAHHAPLPWDRWCGCIDAAGPIRSARSSLRMDPAQCAGGESRCKAGACDAVVESGWRGEGVMG